ncbi:MAG TPA: cytosine permease [Nocardioidaceae bacterium]|nr:cytosine permease [Nocardioidaceae bacterium]
MTVTESAESRSYETSLKVERRSIEFIPPSERHGRVQSLFAIWFAANMQITTIVTGALGVLVGLPLPWAILAIVIGNVVGAVFMALHSAQGPRLGIPQMIQSRAQFGFYGAILPLVLVVIMYVGFFATSAVLGGQALAGATGWPADVSVILVSAACTLLAIFGYRLIHQAERWISLLSGLGFVYLSYRLLATNDVGGVWHGGPVPAGTFLLVVAIAATWQITYAPYVADYSRYLPRKTSISATFWWTYAGSVIGTIWMMAFGCIAVSVASKAFNGGSVSFVVDQAQGARGLFSLIIILGVIAVNVLNLYGCFMSSATTLTAIRRHGVGPAVRVAYVIVAAIVGTVIGIVGSGNFLQNYENFILFLAYFLIPWTAINLTDFYFVRKERYDIKAIFDPASIYGGANWRALAAYLVAIAVEIPFMSTTFYTGPMVSHLGGADISWILGIIVAAGLYYLLMFPIRHRIEAEGAAADEAMTALAGADA